MRLVVSVGANVSVAVTLSKSVCVNVIIGVTLST